MSSFIFGNTIHVSYCLRVCIQTYEHTYYLSGKLETIFQYATTNLIETVSWNNNLRMVLIFFLLLIQKTKIYAFSASNPQFNSAYF